MKTPNWFLSSRPISYILWPMSILYYSVSRLVYFCRLFRQKTSKRPVICIGNILAGGVGKTPIVMDLAGKYRAPVVSRGYAGGDEPKMMRDAGIDVYTGDRLYNINELNQKAGKNMPIIMDDGFQNPIIKKDISILVFDENIGVGNGFMLPAGPLREPISAVRRADGIIIIGHKAKGIGQKISKHNPNVFYAKSRTILPAFTGDFIAFAGIGYPGKFFDALPRRPIRTMAFPDHHEYTAADIKKLREKAGKCRAKLITTAKDFARLPCEFQGQVIVAKHELKLEPKFYEWLDLKLGKIGE
jgi:tetraacyldisaccharide 4'-kinase